MVRLIEAVVALADKVSDVFEAAFLGGVYLFIWIVVVGLVFGLPIMAVVQGVRLALG